MEIRGNLGNQLHFTLLFYPFTLFQSLRADVERRFFVLSLCSFYCGRTVKTVFSKFLSRTFSRNWSSTFVPFSRLQVYQRR